MKLGMLALMTNIPKLINSCTIKIKRGIKNVRRKQVVYIIETV